jgi:hypothetical protein
MPGVSIRPTNDLREVAKELREVADGKQLRRELTGGIRDALRPVVRLAQAAWRAAPEGDATKSRERAAQGDLRVLLAKATRLEVRTSGRMAGARIRVDGRKMPGGMRALPGYAEGERPRWRHPVFGDTDTWVSQAAFPTFYRTVEPHRDNVGRAIDDVLEDVKRKIEAQR